MNTEIKLPPLPEPAAYFTVDTGTGYFAGQVEQSHANDKDVVGLYGDLQLQDYARAAVEADRKQRWLKERAQLDAEWFSLRQMKEAYETDRRRIEGEA